MNIIEKRVKDLKPYEKNPRKNDDAVQYVANSIKEFGFRVPIVIDSDNTIVCGHTRWKASKLLNMETVPCVVADDLTEEQIKAFRIADNKVSEMAGWDFPMLDAELAEIEMLDMEDFGFANTDDIIVYITGEHSCMTARGIKKTGVKTETMSAHGVFEQTNKKQEFLAMI